MSHVVLPEGTMPTTFSTLLGLLAGSWVVNFSCEYHNLVARPVHVTPYVTSADDEMFLAIIYVSLSQKTLPLQNLVAIFERSFQVSMKVLRISNGNGNTATNNTVDSYVTRGF